MSVYIEVVLLNNFAVDALLLVATQLFRRKPINKWGTAFSSLFGAFLATAYVAMPQLWQHVVRLFLAPAMCLIMLHIPIKLSRSPQKQNKSFLRKTGILIGDFVATVLIFSALTFLAGGTVMGLGYLLNKDLNGSVLTGFTAMGVLVALLIASSSARRRSMPQKPLCSAAIGHAGAISDLTAFKDSGNNLTDLMTGLPVVILSRTAADVLDLKPSGEISVHTVSGENSLPTARIDFIEVDGKKYSALCALSDRDFSDCDLILQNSLF